VERMGILIGFRGLGFLVRVSRCEVNENFNGFRGMGFEGRF
jgi:hypothetical protein